MDYFKNESNKKLYCRKCQGTELTQNSIGKRMEKPFDLDWRFLKSKRKHLDCSVLTKSGMIPQALARVAALPYLDTAA